jgi:hypothetical protein
LGGQLGDFSHETSGQPARFFNTALKAEAEDRLQPKKKFWRRKMISLKCRYRPLDCFTAKTHLRSSYFFKPKNAPSPY